MVGYPIVLNLLTLLFYFWRSGRVCTNGEGEILKRCKCELYNHSWGISGVNRLMFGCFRKREENG